jgi:hypothetical protein
MAEREPSGSLKADLEFGNASVDYATVVHENLAAHHPVGQAKYLESALLEALPSLPDRLSKRLNAILKGAL